MLSAALSIVDMQPTLFPCLPPRVGCRRDSRNTRHNSLPVYTRITNTYFARFITTKQQYTQNKHNNNDGSRSNRQANSCPRCGVWPSSHHRPAHPRLHLPWPRPLRRRIGKLLLRPTLRFRAWRVSAGARTWINIYS